MTETSYVKAANYEKAEILDVAFLTTARIKVMIDGQEQEIVVSVDIVNRKVYDEHPGESVLSERVFEFLDKVNTLPENFFAASEEIAKKAAEMKSEHEKFDMTAMGVQR